jgi:hypothetical protein
MSSNLLGNLALVVAAALVAVGCTVSSQRGSGAAGPPASLVASPSAGVSASPSAGAVASPTASGYWPQIDPANFSSTIDNPYLPMTPGTTFVYEGTTEGEGQQDVMVVTRQTKEILGVACVVVKDTARHDGALLEQTDDWYAQDGDGNVWYFGEDTKEYEEGKVVSTEGSWVAGVDGAQPGVVMPAHPQVTDSFRQEYYPGHAEDLFWIVGLAQPVSVPYGQFEKAALTLEWTRLEPDVIDRKYYVPGVGLVLEASAAGPQERAVLVSITKT